MCFYTYHQKSTDFAAKEKEMQEEINKLRANEEASSAGKKTIREELMLAKADLAIEKEGRAKVEEELEEIKAQNEALKEELEGASSAKDAAAAIVENQGQ